MKRPAMSSSLPNGLPRHLTMPSLFSLVAPDARPLLRDLQVADRSEGLRVLYTGPQLELGELEVLTTALKFGAALPAAAADASHVALRVDVFLVTLRMQGLEEGEEMLKDMLSNLSQGSILIDGPGSSIRVPLLASHQFAVGIYGLDPAAEYCYLTVDPLITTLVLHHVHPDTNTGQLVLDVQGAMTALAGRRSRAAAAAEAAANEAIAQASAAKPGQQNG